MVGLAGIAQYPGVLRAAALGAVDDERSLPQRHSGKPAGDHIHLLPAQNEGAQVDVSGGEVVAGPGWQAGEVHHLLGDPVAGIVQDLGPGLGQLGIGGPGTDHNAVAARLGDRLDYELVEALQHLGPLVLFPQQVGVGIGDDRRLAQVVADHVGHIGVHRFVVAHSVAHRVGQRHRAGPGRGHQPGHSQGGAGVEHHRVQEGVVDAAIYHVHLL